MIQSLFLIIYNGLRFGIKKHLGRAHTDISGIQRISPRARVAFFPGSSIVLGHNLDIRPGSEILVFGGASLSIGAGTFMNRYCMISCHQSVSIGKGCMFGPGVKIFDNNHRFSRQSGVSSELSAGTVTIGDNCWIASDAVILKGAHIGHNCVIGAGCVISGQIPPCSLVRMNPALKIEPIR